VAGLLPILIFLFRELSMEDFLNELMLYLLGVFILVLPALLVVQLFNRS